MREFEDDREAILKELFFNNFTVIIHVSRNVRKRTFWHVGRTKTQISLRIRAVWSVSLSAWSNFASLAI